MQNSDFVPPQNYGGVKISHITETRKGRFALFCEENGEESFIFSVDGETLIKYNISEGSLLSGEELYCVRQQSDIRRAKDKALEYIGMRDYAETELYKKLLLKFDKHTSAEVIRWLKELEMLDDRNFACHRAQYLFNKGKSRVQVTAALRGLGISTENIETALNTVQPDDEKLVLSLIEKSYGEKLRRGKRENVTAALLRRGFPVRIVVSAINAYCEENEIAESGYFDF